MKSYTIGREETCNIVIADSSQMVSRLHATLTLDGSKMTITDSSSNGTYINGIRIASGTAVPVTRKDVVSFAQVAELDWAQIPNPGKRTLWIDVGEFGYGVPEWDLSLMWTICNNMDKAFSSESSNRRLLRRWTR